MKALPLWQPWASLVAVGAKRVETRHWPAYEWLIGQRVVVHATKVGLSKRDERAFLDEPVFRGALTEAGIEIPFGDPGRNLPRGALICTVVIDRCTEITAASAKTLLDRNPSEYAFGNYAPGRFAWVLRDVEVLPEPIPFKGRQGIFDVPDELLAQAVSR